MRHLASVCCGWTHRHSTVFHRSCWWGGIRVRIPSLLVLYVTAVGTWEAGMTRKSSVLVHFAEHWSTLYSNSPCKPTKQKLSWPTEKHVWSIPQSHLRFEAIKITSPELACPPVSKYMMEQVWVSFFPHQRMWLEQRQWKLWLPCQMLPNQQLPSFVPAHTCWDLCSNWPLKLSFCVSVPWPRLLSM